MKKILIAAGGTGGHIYPGLAIADAIKRKISDAQIIFVGSYVGAEKNIIPHYGYTMELINAQGFERGFSKDTVEAGLAMFQCTKDVRKLLKKYSPDLVIGTGGFTCAMLLLVAALKKYPTLIHEQNSYPGRANRLLGRFVDKICITFESSRSFFPEEKICFTGNPVREKFKLIRYAACRKQLGLSDNIQLVVATGGSQGAGTINFAVIHWIENSFPDNRMIWLLTGEDTYDQVVDLARRKLPLDSDRIIIECYSEKTDVLFGAADLVISRAGATSIVELAAAGAPSVLVPYPRAAGDHQMSNAKDFADTGGAVIIPDDQFTGERLKEQIDVLLASPEQLAAMRISAKSFGLTDADDRVAKEAVALMDKI